jgi:hypothetical protein
MLEFETPQLWYPNWRLVVACKNLKLKEYGSQLVQPKKLIFRNTPEFLKLKLLSVVMWRL